MSLTHLLFLAAASLPAIGMAAAAPLGETPRRLVVFAPSPEDPRLLAQRRIYEAARPGAAERDLAWVDALGGGAEAHALRRRLGVPDAPFLAVLVGRDGGAKLVREEPVAAAELFGEIDSMPMRRQEMRRGAAR